jgi:dCMP deaminase
MPKKTAIVAYVPALHAGYKRLFDKHPNADILVIDETIIAGFDHLRKEIRSLSPKEAAAAIGAWGNRAETLSLAKLKTLATNYGRVVLPKDEIGTELAQNYLSDMIVQFEDIFLRWDRRLMEASQDALNPNRTISKDPFDQKVMTEAVEVSRESTNIWRRVGAAIVKNEKVVMKASNQHQPLAHSNWVDGDPRNNANRGTAIEISTDMHAEARLIARAAKEGTALEGTSIYVTTFPCPVCAKLIANAGFTTCYYAVGYAMLDGEEVLTANGVKLVQVEGVSIDDPNPDVWQPYPEKTNGRVAKKP